jgi:phosphotransferase system HPr-like phosphotransfer protein
MLNRFEIEISFRNSESITNHIKSNLRIIYSTAVEQKNISVVCDDKKENNAGRDYVDKLILITIE